MNRIGITSTYWGTTFTASVEEYDQIISRSARLGFNMVSLAQDVPLELSKSDQQRLQATAKLSGRSWSKTRPLFRFGGRPQKWG